MKVLFTLLFVCVSALSFSQTVKFDEVAFNVSATDFAQSLKAAGFEQVGDYMYGNIEPYGECSIDFSKPNYAFIVLPESSNWQDLLHTYNELKSKFSSKYVQSSVDESFTSDQQPQTDDDKFWEAKFGRCNYQTMYSTQNNYIAVCINSNADFSCSVAISLENISANLGHLEFMGCPIDGTLDAFIEKMEAKGFKAKTNLDAAFLMKGDFAGYSNCSLHIYSSKREDFVFMVGISFPELYTWESLYANYYYLKSMLTQKYGDPISMETFDTDVQPTDDNERMYQVQQNRCKYYSCFYGLNGLIKLEIQHVLTSSHVSLVYEDSENMHRYFSNSMDDL